MTYLKVTQNERTITWITYIHIMKSQYKIYVRFVFS
jgi:hypothetical protein